LAVGVASMLLGACSQGEAPETREDTGSSTPTTSAPAPRLGPPADSTVPTPTIDGPITAGNGAPTLGPPGFDLSTVGYTEEEYFLSGAASSYTSATPLTEDGRWDVTTDGTAPYTTRVVVRRPQDPSAFDGTVVVEWLNVSGGLDASPDWSYAHDEIVRSGSAWIGVSAQRAGIEGGGNPLGAALALKNADPQRYSVLDHPGDEFSYDIFSQAGAAVWSAPDRVLGGLQPEMVLAVGESQSAFRLTTYVDAIAPIADIYDGYLVHSRAASGAPCPTRSRPPTRPRRAPIWRSRCWCCPRRPTWSATAWATDGRVSPTVTGSPAGRWPAPRTPTRTTWASRTPTTARARVTTSCSPRWATRRRRCTSTSSAATGRSTPDRTPTSPGALARWRRGAHRCRPPAMPQLDLDDGGDDRCATGRHRTAASAARRSTSPSPRCPASASPTGPSALFGTTVAFGAAQLADRYPDHGAFVSEWNQAVDAMVTAGALLDADATELRRVAEQSSIGR
jgi:hypothetical protein